MKTSDPLYDAMAKSCRRLEMGDVVRFDTVCNGMKIECREGRLWITQTDLETDIVLATGDFFEPRRAGRIVVQALEKACFTNSCN